MKLTSLEGVFRNDRVELSEPLQAREETRVLVTFLPEEGAISLPAQGINAEKAADLRAPALIRRGLGTSRYGSI